MDNKFTEEEAINITIDHGYDGSEFNTAVWKDRGCLIPNRTMDALISKLETIYHTVKVEGRGKKRNYILKDKKEEMTDREYNYKGTLPTEEEEEMKEYIFNILVNTGVGNAKPYNSWIRDFELFQPMPFSSKTLIAAMKELHAGVRSNSKEIVNEFIKAINNYNKSIVESSFRRLNTHR